MVRFFDRKKIVRRLLRAEKVPPLPPPTAKTLELHYHHPSPPTAPLHLLSTCSK